MGVLVAVALVCAAVVSACGLVGWVGLVVPHMAQQRSGLIVNIGSFFDKLGVKRNLAYCASKAGLIRYLESLRAELRGSGVRVSALLR